MDTILKNFEKIALQEILLLEEIQVESASGWTPF
jgi:hypothetical protein